MSDLIRIWRSHSQRTIRDVSDEIGISQSTLCRVEKGEMMDAQTLGRILIWMLNDEKKGG